MSHRTNHSRVLLGMTLCSVLCIGVMSFAENPPVRLPPSEPLDAVPLSESPVKAPPIQGKRPAWDVDLPPPLPDTKITLGFYWQANRQGGETINTVGGRTVGVAQTDNEGVARQASRLKAQLLGAAYQKPVVALRFGGKKDGLQGWGVVVTAHDGLWGGLPAGQERVAWTK